MPITLALSPIDNADSKFSTGLLFHFNNGEIEWSFHDQTLAVEIHLQPNVHQMLSHGRVRLSSDLISPRADSPES